MIKLLPLLLLASLWPNLLAGPLPTPSPDIPQRPSCLRTTCDGQDFFASHCNTDFAPDWPDAAANIVSPTGHVLGSIHLIEPPNPNIGCGAAFAFTQSIPIAPSPAHATGSYTMYTDIERDFVYQSSPIVTNAIQVSSPMLGLTGARICASGHIYDSSPPNHPVSSQTVCLPASPLPPTTSPEIRHIPGASG